MQSQMTGSQISRLCSGVISALLVATAAHASTQWVSTATKGFPADMLKATEAGALSGSTPLHVVVGLKVRNPEQVQPTLKRMLTPGDPLYGKSFTVEEYVERFAPSSAQVEEVEKYLASYGFKNVQAESNHLLVQADGTAAQAESAFNTAMWKFKLNGKTFFANALDAQVPEYLSGTVSAVLGLNNGTWLRSDIHNVQKRSSLAAAKGVSPDTDPCNPLMPLSCPTPDPANETFTAAQYWIAYDAADPGSTPAATKLTQKVPMATKTNIGVIVEGDLGCIHTSPCPITTAGDSGQPSAKSTGVMHDLYLYDTDTTDSGNKLVVPKVYLVPAGVLSPDTAGAEEWDLDTQASTGIAGQVAGLYLYIATSLTDSDIALAINKAVTQNKVKGFNMSFGECEVFPYLDGAMLVDDTVFGEAALQGITPFAASGDNGGQACPYLPTNGVTQSGPPDVSYPASSPYVIASGSTDLLTNANYTYDEELGANFSGGGISYFEDPPFWQGYTGSGTAPIVPSYELSVDGVGRGVPDVGICGGGAFLAICSPNIEVAGTITLVGGTSLSSPLTMGSWARIETAHNNSVGFAGPLIYQLANGAPTVSSPYFNDVVAGCNSVFLTNCAVPGYDYTTGLGSWDIYVINKNLPTTYPH
jgi:subtilase family serine protease